MKFKTYCLTMMALAVSGVLVAADTVTWTDVSSVSANWFTTANWLKGATPYGNVPTNGENVVLTDLPAIETTGDDGGNAGMGDTRSSAGIWFGQTLYTPVSDNSTTYTDPAARLAANPNVVISKVTGDSRHAIAIDYTTSAGQYQIKNTDKIVAPDGGKGRYLAVSDPDDFLGSWTPYGVWSRLIVNPNDTLKTAVLHNLVATYSPYVSVMEDASAKVELVTGGGAVRTYGPGKLTIGEVTAEQTRLVIEGSGEVELLGHTGAELDALFAKAAVHLDATKDDSLVLGTDSDSNTVVWRWNDCDGRAVYAHANTNRALTASHQISQSLPPRFKTEATANGLPLLDFSYRGNGVASQTPGVVMELSQRYTNVRAVFYVAECPNGAGNAWIFGDYPPSGSSLQFCPGDSADVLYSDTYSDPCVRAGDIFLNSKNRIYYKCNGELIKLHTVAQNVLRDANVFLLCSREYYASSTGGARLGEVLLFTNDLTRVERVQISNYLNRKWDTSDDGGYDFHEIYVSDNLEVPATISVPAGRTAKIGKLRLKSYGTSYGLTKTGAGTLEVDEVYPSNAKITVADGDIVFRKTALVSDTEPADGAYVWLDATKATELLVENGTNYVTKWNDCRGAGTYAITNVYSWGMHKPRLVDSPITGTKVIDFGRANTDQTVRDNYDSAGMRLSNWSSATYGPTYHYFAVMRMKSVNLAQVPIISGSDMNTYRDGASIFSTNFRAPLPLASCVTLNGVAVDPASVILNSNTPATTNQFYVVSVSTETPFNMNALACQRSGSPEKTCGGMEFAEVITYVKPLTPAEHQQTEAYLMKKWLGKTHPAQGGGSPRLTYETTNEAVLNTDVDLALDKVTGGDGAIVKRGAGDVSVGKLNVAPKTITVSAGSLQLPYAATDFLDEAAFLFDASRPDTMTYEVEGGVTNVRAIADTRGNGWTAVADNDDLATDLPRLVSVEHTPGSGQYIPALDFGKYSWRTNAYSSVNGSASMRFQKDGAFTTQNFKEMFVVFADADGCHQASVLGNTDQHQFQRNWNTGALLRLDSSVAALDAGGIPINARASSFDTVKGEIYTKVPTAGFHRLDWVCATEGRSIPNSGWNSGVPIDAIARVYGSVRKGATGWPYDYDLVWEDRGGILIAEQLAFSEFLSQEQADYVLKLLNAKWFGAAHPGYLVTNAIDRISVADGAALTLNDALHESSLLTSVKALEGGGSIAFPNLYLTDSIDATIANGRSTCLTLDGTLALDGTLTINVTADLANGMLKAGLYPIVKANAIEGFDGTQFTVNVLTTKSGIDMVRVQQIGNTIYLSVTKRGIRITFR